MNLIEAVANANGGRGKTTVYTLDAASMYSTAEAVKAALKAREKGADSAPFEPGKGRSKRRERVQKPTRKGAGAAPHSVLTLSDSVRGLDVVGDPRAAAVEDHGGERTRLEGEAIADHLARLWDLDRQTKTAGE
jgi:hypothetical protein